VSWRAISADARIWQTKYYVCLELDASETYLRNDFCSPRVHCLRTMLNCATSNRCNNLRNRIWSSGSARHQMISICSRSFPPRFEMSSWGLFVRSRSNPRVLESCAQNHYERIGKGRGGTCVGKTKPSATARCVKLQWLSQVCLWQLKRFLKRVTPHFVHYSEIYYENLSISPK